MPRTLCYKLVFPTRHALAPTEQLVGVLNYPQAMSLGSAFTTINVY